MCLKSKGFKVFITYPSLCLFTILIICNSDYFYCLVGILLHEASHIISMKLLKIDIKGVSISCFDIRIIEGSRRFVDFKKDIIITSAGPMINIILFILFYYFNNRFAWINLFIGLFNLLPAASLDGGQLLYLVLNKKLSDKKSALITDIVTVVISIPLFFFGIIILFESKYNFSLLFLSLFLILSLFIKEDRYL